ncbi:MAG: hypothetical protein E7774_05050 [Bradyrhizobium sp.]|nr:MAG: hypothetical protein E7774_05050 [Bradyrhizobium sp.]
MSERRVADALDGAPLDAIKIVAAASMVCDHLNDMAFHHRYLALWYAGRLAFPLFCLVLALNLERGASATRYAAYLTPFAIVSQPIYKAAFHDGLDNVLITLLLAIFVAELMLRLPRWGQHVVFATGAAASFAAPWTAISTGLCFGVAGLLLPSALTLILQGRRDAAPWALLLYVGLNWFPRDELFDSLFAPLVVLIAAAAILALARRLAGRRRFLPRFALYAFYPLHLLALIGWRALA